jgi:hypothetical protein
MRVAVVEPLDFLLLPAVAEVVVAEIVQHLQQLQQLEL